MVEVQVLGPVRLVGWPDPSAWPRPTALELLAFMALHPGQHYRAEQLRNVIGRGRTTDLDLDTIRRCIRALRRVLGPERVPATRPGGGYQVLGISTDAGRFEQPLQVADAAAAPADQALHLAQALARPALVATLGRRGIRERRLPPQTRAAPRRYNRDGVS